MQHQLELRASPNVLQIVYVIVQPFFARKYFKRITMCRKLFNEIIILRVLEGEFVFL